MGGDPNPESCLLAIESVVRGGADMLEIGVPFSDPMADGKSIQAAGVRALLAGTRPANVLEIAHQAKEAHDVPVILMTYFNPIYSTGIDRFLDSARRARVDGLIVPDLPLEEAEAFGKSVRRRGIDSILLAAPTTGSERMKKVVTNTSGFLYLVSVLGVTGARLGLRPETMRLVKFARRFTADRIPLAVGFGISKPEHIGAVVEAGADAAIVGSAIVDRVACLSEEGERAFHDIETYVRSMKRATIRTG